jgi:muramoyltetrapeptide carboxypeptidase
MVKKKPRPLRKGDVVAIFAPAGPVDPKMLRRGTARLSEGGYVPEIAEGLFKEKEYLAGDDVHRAKQLNWALSLPEVRAAMAARGGYGSARILPLVDWRKAFRRPVLVVGYSDVTAVLSYLSTRLGIPSVHGPMAAADLARLPAEETLSAFARLAAGEVAPGEPWGPPCERLRGGAAKGILAGGCLSVLTSLLGTPFEPDFAGTLLFLEDVSEPCYRIDRMLNQWIQSGRLSRIEGIVAGDISPVAGERPDDLRRVFAEAGRRLAVPVWYGFPAGHGRMNVALPFGVGARIDKKGRLFLLESPVSLP